MFFLLFTVIVGTILAILATQNTLGVTAHLGPYTWTNIPLYLVSLLSLITGLVISWVLGVMGWASTSLTLRNKDQRLKSAETTVDDLEAKIRHLEEENDRLKDKNVQVKEKAEIVEHNDESPHPLEKLRHTLSR